MKNPDELLEAIEHRFDGKPQPWAAIVGIVLALACAAAVVGSLVGIAIIGEHGSWQLRALTFGAMGAGILGVVCRAFWEFFRAPGRATLPGSEPKLDDEGNPIPPYPKPEKPVKPGRYKKL